MLLVLLQEGHLWGRRTVAIPVAAVDRITERGVDVTLTKNAIERLPEIELGPHAG